MEEFYVGLTEEPLNSFPSVSIPLMFPLMYVDFNFSTLYQCLISSLSVLFECVFYNCSYSRGCKVVSYSDFDLHFPNY